MSEPGMAEIFGAVTQLAAGVNRLGTDLRAELTATRAALMDRMDRLQNSLTSPQEDGIVTMGTADFAHRKIDHTREEVRLIGEQLSLLRRQIIRAENRIREIDGKH
jgi:hypothetical protein